MTDIQMIPLNKLDRDPMNVRKTYRAEGIIELAASIKAVPDVPKNHRFRWSHH